MVLKIGDFSRLTFVSVKTLRYYDELGLLRPVRVDEFTGYRYYSADQLPRLNRILALKDLGLSLEEVKKLGQLMGRVRFLGPPMGIYHDPEFREQDVNVEVAIPIEGDVPGGGPVKARVLEAADAACLVHKGSYETIGEAYNAAMAWLEPNGYRIAGPVREVYLNGPGDTQDPAQYVTEIQAPVEKA